MLSRFALDDTWHEIAKPEAETKQSDIKSRCANTAESTERI